MPQAESCDGKISKVHGLGRINGMLRVLFVLPSEYPRGSAAANRLQKLARGLKELGDDVRLIGMCWQKQHTNLAEWFVDEYGVQYRMVFVGAGERTSVLADKFTSEVSRCVQKGAVDIIYIYGQSWRLYRNLVKYCRSKGTPIIADFTEWHQPTLGVQAFKRWMDQSLFRCRLLPKLGGAVAISSIWYEYLVRRCEKVVLIPALSDEPQPLESQRLKESASFELLYVGSLAARDLPLTMVRGVKIARSLGVPVCLSIVGKPCDTVMSERLNKILCADSELRAAVKLVGWVDDRELERRLYRACALVLLRPNSPETRACFPTRLPEYLITGSPVVISDVGDVGHYLKHREDAWLLPPGDQPEALADAIATLWKDADEAMRIGAAGRRASAEHFGYALNAARFHQFLMDGFQIQNMA